MATSISNGESGLSVRTKLNDIWHSLDLNEYNKDITGTAVDVFVYDTSKDSDGGAWRKRTQGTSWYNETLNTATRGSRKEFPAVAVIVAESDTVTIYDGDDPDLPMWMVFNTANNLLVRATTVSSVAMQNGVMSVGSSDSGFSKLNFISERCLVKTTAGYAFPIQSISVRNTGQTIALDGSVGLVNAFVNDVAMTVLPNAPIDAATGLPVPTIAVATAGGVSVIKDDGNVWDSSHTGSSIEMMFVGPVLYGAQESTIATWRNYGDVSSISADGFTHKTLGTATTPALLGRTESLSPVASGSDTTFGSAGVTFIQEDGVTYANSMVAYVTSTYNTGWMNGDIKLATLSDTDATNVTGSELVTNGTFDTDTSGWTANALTTSVSSGQATLTMTSTYGTFVQGITTVVGETYTITCDIVSETVSGTLYLGAGTTSGGSQLGLSATSVGSNAFTFVATGTTTYVALYFNGASSQAAVIDNFTARLAEEDRSVNGKGLQVFGTVTKSAVATGADLVAYGPFSSSNGIVQPYNSGLDFGTDDFSISVWHKGTGVNDYILARRTPASNAMYVFIHSSGTVQFFHGSATETGSTSIVTGEWTHICCLRRNGRAYVYVNGVEDTNGASSGSVTLADAKLGIGLRPDSLGTALSSGSLALLRISATAPTAEQIKKIYEDEKVLFQENSQATLYGSSDAVTALAYDDTTELLHVGTSAGRSVFQGLKRVDNTTDAITAAISASNGLVAEE